MEVLEIVAETVVDSHEENYCTLVTSDENITTPGEQEIQLGESHNSMVLQYLKLKNLSKKPVSNRNVYRWLKTFSLGIVFIFHFVIYIRPCNRSSLSKLFSFSYSMLSLYNSYFSTTYKFKNVQKMNYFQELRRKIKSTSACTSGTKSKCRSKKYWLNNIYFPCMCINM